MHGNFLIFVVIQVKDPIFASLPLFREVIIQDNVLVLDLLNILRANQSILPDMAVAPSHLCRKLSPFAQSGDVAHYTKSLS